MVDNSVVPLATIAALVGTPLWLLWQKRHSNGLPLPPGPRGLPIIGNLFDMPSKDEFEVARRWGEKYGDVIYVKVLGRGYLFVNSYEVAAELFEKRGSIYSGRPQTTLLELEGWTEWAIPLMSNEDSLHMFKQLFNRFFQKSAMKDYYEVQTQGVNRLLLKMLEGPGTYRKHIKNCSTETIIKVAYGFSIIEDDPIVEILDRGVRALSEAMSFFLVNAFPALRHLPSWFPGARFHKIAQEGRKLSLAMHTVPYNEARRKMAEGTSIPSMISKLLESDEEGVDESVIAKTVTVAYSAGGDTTVAALLTFMLAMVLHPDAVRKGQEELDRVIGGNRLPTFEDRASLPYIEAICKECLRWQTVASLGICTASLFIIYYLLIDNAEGVPHLLTKDDVYNGYFIPAGTTVIPNAWAMLRDPKRYPDPEKFIPDRWLQSPGRTPPLDANKIAFGFGRRICPGRFFAENSIFIGVASILAVFNIGKAVDADGVPITPIEDYDSNLGRQPKPFPCRITPRSEKAATLIREAASLGK